MIKYQNKLRMENIMTVEEFKANINLTKKDIKESIISKMNEKVVSIGNKLEEFAKTVSFRKVVFECVIKNTKVYTSNKDYSNYVFFKTKYMCSDKNGNTIFGDFLTGEVRSILESKKKSVRVDKFMSSSDNFSVAVLFDHNKNTFYIFYL